MASRMGLHQSRFTKDLITEINSYTEVRREAERGIQKIPTLMLETKFLTQRKSQKLFRVLRNAKHF